MPVLTHDGKQRKRSLWPLWVPLGLLTLLLAAAAALPFAPPLFIPLPDGHWAEITAAETNPRYPAPQGFSQVFLPHERSRRVQKSRLRVGNILYRVILTTRDRFSPHDSNGSLHLGVSLSRTRGVP